MLNIYLLYFYAINTLQQDIARVVPSSTQNEYSDVLDKGKPFPRRFRFKATLRSLADASVNIVCYAD